MALCNVIREDKFSELTIVFQFTMNDCERTITLNRSVKETLETCVRRMVISLKKAFKITQDDFKIEFYHNNQLIEQLHDWINRDFWQDGSEMHINGNTYLIRKNYPNILALSICDMIFIDFYAYPRIRMLGNVVQSDFVWFKKPNYDKKKDGGENVNQDQCSWSQIGVGFLYKVKNEDLGCHLKVICTPKKDNLVGLPKEAISRNPVAKGPENCPFEMRFFKHHNDESPTTEPNQFRIVSYNLLADSYADSKYSRDTLYSYCDNAYLNFEYRKSLIVKELMGYQSDIYFLQELDSSFFGLVIKPLMKSLDFKSYFIAKKNNSEGLCIIHNRRKFECLNQEAFIIADLLVKRSIFAKLKSKIDENRNLMNRIKKLQNTFQLVTLRSTWNREKILLLCNLHLYSRDDADHIRLIQAFIVLKYIEHYLETIREQNPDCQTSIILSGDFNSTPDVGVIKLIQTKSVDTSIEDFQSNKLEVIENFEFQHNLDLESACGFPDYTHYTKDFYGCLDYILYDEINFKVIDVVPMPEHEEVIKEIALPNEKFPSDHIPLICTLAWI